MIGVWGDSRSHCFEIVFLNFTTTEKKTGFFLMQVFRKTVHTQIYGHQGSLLGGLSYLSGLVRILRLRLPEQDKTM
jgi:hypothetical protein